MMINKEINEDSIILKVCGWLDTLSSVEFGEAIDNLGSYKSLVIDFDELEFISSSGIRQLLRANKKAISKNSDFSIINVNEEIMEVFAITGLDEAMNISKK